MSVVASATSVVPVSTRNPLEKQVLHTSGIVTILEQEFGDRIYMAGSGVHEKRTKTPTTLFVTVGSICIHKHPN
jgi:hypothetical protein